MSFGQYKGSTPPLRKIWRYDGLKEFGNTYRPPNGKNKVYTSNKNHKNLAGPLHPLKGKVSLHTTG